MKMSLHQPWRHWLFWALCLLVAFNVTVSLLLFFVYQPCEHLQVRKMPPVHFPKLSHVAKSPSEIISLLRAVKMSNANQGPASCYVIIYRSSQRR